MDVKLYSNHCPKCNMIKKLLDNKNIAYEIIDNEDIFMPIAVDNKISSMPFADINGDILNTKQLQEFIGGQ